MDKRIIRFLKRGRIMTLSTSVGGVSWCAPLFYVYDSELNWLVFTSSSCSRHIVEGLANSKVSVSVVGRAYSVARLRGAQITGILHSCNASSEKLCREKFLRRFKLPSKSLDKMWYVEIETVKYTDNRLGFATKLHYPTL